MYSFYGFLLLSILGARVGCVRAETHILQFLSGGDFEIESQWYLAGSTQNRASNSRDTVYIVSQAIVIWSHNPGQRWIRLVHSDAKSSQVTQKSGDADWAACLCTNCVNTSFWANSEYSLPRERFDGE